MEKKKNSSLPMAKFCQTARFTAAQYQNNNIKRRPKQKKKKGIYAHCVKICENKKINR